MYLQIASIYIYHGYLKQESIFRALSHRPTMFWVNSQEQHYKIML